MTTESRIIDAEDSLRSCQMLLTKATQVPDPVARRRLIVIVARTMREAANLLDDHGRLTT